MTFFYKDNPCLLYSLPEAPREARVRRLTQAAILGFACFGSPNNKARISRKLGKVPFRGALPGPLFHAFWHVKMAVFKIDCLNTCFKFKAKYKKRTLSRWYRCLEQILYKCFTVSVLLLFYKTGIFSLVLKLCLNTREKFMFRCGRTLREA